MLFILYFLVPMQKFIGSLFFLKKLKIKNIHYQNPNMKSSKITDNKPRLKLAYVIDIIFLITIIYFL